MEWTSVTADRLGDPIPGWDWAAHFFILKEGISMKKLNQLSESSFLKLVFGFLSLCCLVAAFCVPDRGQMLSGLWQIVSRPSKLTSNYFAMGGFSATFLNMALVGFACLGLFWVFGGTANAGSTLAFILTMGFSSWGINIGNIWFTFLGVMLYGVVKKESFGSLVNAMMFSTGIAPIITELMVRYPNAETVGFNLPGLLLALFIGLVIGFFLPAGLAHSPKVHKGFDLYSAALPIGMTAFFLNAALFKTLGVELPAGAAAADLAVADPVIVNGFCLAVFGLSVAAAFAMGCKPADYLALLKHPDQVSSISTRYGNATFLMNLGVYGLFILGYYNLVGATFNAVTLGVVFCMLCCCNSGSHPGNVWPIMVGYVLSSLVFGWFSSLVGGSFAEAANAQAIVVGLCFANGLSPVSDKYGWPAGLVAGIMHYMLVTSVPNLHGGFCLYNGGLTAAVICILLVPQLERFFHTRAERQSLKS